MQDMRSYRAVRRRPIRSTYRGMTVIGMGPPSSGGIAVAQALNLLEGVDVAGMRHNGLDYVTNVLQAHNLAFADRDKYVGDGDFVAMPLGWLNDEECGALSPDVCDSRGCKAVAGACEAKGLVSKRYAKGRREEYMRQPWPAAPLPYGGLEGGYAPSPPKEETGTTHFVAVDAQGNTVRPASSSPSPPQPFSHSYSRHSTRRSTAFQGMPPL